jgi:hemerythrin-like metal-binding protein
MAYIAWKPAYEVGVPEIDEQHKILLSYVNKLEEAKGLENNEKVIRETIVNVVNYTKTHFADEEKLMREAGYPLAGQHQALHAGIINQVVSILEKLKTQQSVAVDELLHFLRDWFINHVIEHDKQISLFIQSDIARKKQQGK